jgi:hypothetical protein
MPASIQAGGWILQHLGTGTQYGQAVGYNGFKTPEG